MSTSGERVVLDALLDLQAHDTAIDRLRHRRESLDERADLAAAEARLAEVSARADDVGGRDEDARREEQRFDDEARSLEQRAADMERRMYSGEVTSPRELQAMQADVDMLRRHRRTLEDRELAVMERREALDAERAEVVEVNRTLESDVARLRAALAEKEGEIDAELALETAARDDLAATIQEDLVVEYERCRARARGVGVARLISGTCQGCHLSIPATEAERIRKGPPGTVAHCDNCGCILVP
jgi:predicted  nucleic acid-binding Zn-ribbon protein